MISNIVLHSIYQQFLQCTRSHWYCDMVAAAAVVYFDTTNLTKHSFSTQKSHKCVGVVSIDSIFDFLYAILYIRI